MIPSPECIERTVELAQHRLCWSWPVGMPVGEHYWHAWRGCEELRAGCLSKAWRVPAVEGLTISTFFVFDFSKELSASEMMNTKYGISVSLVDSRVCNGECSVELVV
jgi:hypothetical protein